MRSQLEAYEPWPWLSGAYEGNTMLMAGQGYEWWAFLTLEKYESGSCKNLPPRTPF